MSHLLDKLGVNTVSEKLHSISEVMKLYKDADLIAAITTYIMNDAQNCNCLLKKIRFPFISTV